MHAEKYFILLDLYYEKDTALQATQGKYVQRTEQLQLAQVAINSQSNEIDKLTVKNKGLFIVVVLETLAILFLAIF